MKIFVSAAEISSDIHAEKILKSISNILASKNITVEWCGIGGPRVRSLPGFKVWQNAEDLRTMGLVEVLRKYSFFKAIINRTVLQIDGFKPDLILTFDYPDFHFKLIEKIIEENAAPNALRVCGIPPKVWVWRSKRVEKIRHLFHGVWVIFPFEKKFYQSKGIPVIYEGNPLLEDLPVQESIDFPKKPLETITVMPGSRDGELKCHLPVIPEALQLFSKKINKPVIAQVPVPEGVDVSVLRAALVDTSQVSYRFMPNGSSQSLKETQIGLIKSGTSTLEAAVLGCSPVIFYRMNWLTEQLLRVMIMWIGGYLGPVGLPNILLGVKRREKSVFPELLGPEVTPESLAVQLAKIHSDQQLQNQFKNKCAEIRSLFQLENHETSAAERTAQRILNWVDHQPRSSAILETRSNMMNGVISFIWSSVNLIRRFLYQNKILRSYAVKVPSILIGNLQAGGSGKTPLVIALAKAAVAKGLKTAVISRGYGATADNPLGDEPLEIKQAVPEVNLYIGSNRVKSIKAAEADHHDLILFDDGFQNLKFKPKTTVLAVTDRSRSEVVYRDFDFESKHADLLLGTKGVQFRENFLNQTNKFIQIDWQLECSIEQPVWLYCGIADPSELVSFYRDRGLQIRKIITVGDHDALSEDAVKSLMADAKKDGCVLAMTQKDKVKFPELAGNLMVLTRSIRNQDWIDAVFKSTI